MNVEHSYETRLVTVTLTEYEAIILRDAVCWYRSSTMALADREEVAFTLALKDALPFGKRVEAGATPRPREKGGHNAA